MAHRTCAVIERFRSARSQLFSSAFDTPDATPAKRLAMDHDAGR